MGINEWETYHVILKFKLKYMLTEVELLINRIFITSMNMINFKHLQDEILLFRMLRLMIWKHNNNY